MSLYTFSVAPTNSTDANFRAWGSAISTGLSTAGWVKTADTGQIDWVNVLAPTAINTVQGYEIWRMNDALQSTYPVFIKLEYGSGTTVTYPFLAVTIGTGSDGAGNLTGQLSTRRALTSTASSVLFPGFVSGAPNRLVIAPHCGQNGATGSSSHSFIAVIERSHDNTGSDTGAGVQCAWYSSTGSVSSQYITFVGVVQTSYSYASVSPPPTGTGARGSDIYVYPVRCWTPGESAPFLGIHAYFTADLTADQAVPIATWSGQTITALPLGNIAFLGGGTYPVLRYE